MEKDYDPNDDELMDSMYDDLGGKVFDINNDLNTSSQMIMFKS